MHSDARLQRLEYCRSSIAAVKRSGFTLTITTPDGLESGSALEWLLGEVGRLEDENTRLESILTDVAMARYEMATGSDERAFDMLNRALEKDATARHSGDVDAQ